MSILGVDVSHYQGMIDWGKVADSGIQFCIMKAMYEGSHRPDEYFEKNYQGCVANRIKIGAYIFIGSMSAANPKLDAECFLDVINNRPLPYGIWLDAESEKIKALGKKRITQILLTEARVFEQAGYQVGIYTNPYWYNNFIDVELFNNAYPFWVARYPIPDNGTIKDSLSPKKYAEAWQYSSKGQINGIKGHVDLDIDYSLDQFQTYHKVAEQVLAGKWGSLKTNPTREELLTRAGYPYNRIQAMVNAIYKVRRTQV